MSDKSSEIGTGRIFPLVKQMLDRMNKKYKASMFYLFNFKGISLTRLHTDLNLKHSWVLVEQKSLTIAKDIACG